MPLSTTNRHPMSYEKALSNLYDLQKYGIKFGLHNILTLLKKLENPHLSQRFIHITGTNGKGSVSSMIHSILSAAGYKVGLYTSPHLLDFSERMKINNNCIFKSEVIRLSELLFQIIEEERKTDTEFSPTFFEVITAMAFQYFFEQAVDYTILEVGMGGRLDATNAIDHPLVTIVTNVGLEHEEFLGDSIEKIAQEKFGIIKVNSVLVSGIEQDVLIKRLKDVNKERGISDYYQLGKDINYEKKRADKKGCLFDLRIRGKEYNDLEMSLLGSYQIMNASLAVGAIQGLRCKGVHIEDKDIYKGLKTTFWSGRMHLISHEPDILLDGAHNVPGALKLSENLLKLFEGQKKIFILAIMRDKNIKGILDILLPLAEVVIFTKANINRSATPEELSHILKGSLILNSQQTQYAIKETIVEAIDYARQLAKKNDLICITGSLFTVGETLAILGIK
ncbi:MAG: folylpolyglutamate synthase/dihydrofolate synthase family protein [bacterium]